MNLPRLVSETESSGPGVELPVGRVGEREGWRRGLVGVVCAGVVRYDFFLFFFFLPFFSFSFGVTVLMREGDGGGQARADACVLIVSASSEP